MNVLGLSCHFHDAAASLIQDGVVVAAAEEERFSRVKHDSRFPTKAVEFCLESGSLDANDLDYVVYYEKPGLKFDRVISTLSKNFPKSKTLFHEIFMNWGKEKFWVSDMIQSRLRIPKSRILFSEHHLSHSASSYYCSPFSEAGILTVDGVGEWVTTSMGIAKNTKFSRNAYSLFPHSLGLLYTAFTEFLGFEVNDGEYKVMGMAPFGRPKYKDKVYCMFRHLSGNSFELDMDYFAYETSSKSNLTQKFLGLWGNPRQRDEPFYLPQFAQHLGLVNERPDTSILERSQYYADVAASIQATIEDVLIDFSKTIRQRTGLTSLCVAGGVGYNSVANGRIMRESGFENVYIPPGSGDSGAAVGAALAVTYAVQDRPSPQILTHAYLGKAYGDNDITTVLAKNGYAYTCFDSAEACCLRVATLLAQGKVVGWFQGRFEFGARALGHRSILADPRTVAMKETVNARVKFRELFRPFAPACLKPYATKYFELNEQDIEQYPYRFMASVVQVREEWTHLLQAVTHVDRSARVQIVDQGASPKFYELIKAFGDQTGVYALLNTSFNRRGEPIVASPQDALITFEWSAIDILVIGNYLVTR